MLYMTSDSDFSESAGSAASKVCKLNCEERLKSGALDGLLLGAIIGCTIGFMDTIVALVENNGRGIRFFERLVGGMLQGGSLGLLLGTIVSVIKYC